jgi:hypothetical protein
MNYEPKAKKDVGNEQSAFLAALLSIQSMMLFPHNSVARTAYFDSTLAKNLMLAADEPKWANETIKAEIVAWAWRNASDNSKIIDTALSGSWVAPKSDEKNELFLDGFIAAYVLLVPSFVLSREGKEVGKEEDNRALGQYLNDRGYTGRDRPQLIASWRSHQSVAHLWAAYMVRNHDWPRKYEELIDFLKLSEAIRLWAEGYHPLRSKSSLLDGNLTVKLPQRVAADQRWSPEDGLPVSDEWAQVEECIQSARENFPARH